MGIKGPLPDRVLDKIDARERKPLGRAGRTSAEARAGAADKSEKAAQATFWNFTQLKGITVDPSAMHKKTTRRKGMADFPCYYKGRVLFLEFKQPGGKLSAAQEEFRDEIESQGFPYRIAYSASQAIEFAIEHLLT